MSGSIITRRSKASIDAVSARLPDIAKRHDFGVLGVHDLKEKMNSKGIAFDKQCRVFEVCNPHQAQLILNGNMAISAALPCRISVYSEGTDTVLATIDPTALIGLFGDAPAGAKSLAADVQHELVMIMDESCVG